MTMRSEVETLRTTSKTEYYQEPGIVIQRPTDRTYAFTMRLTNFLLRLKIIKRTQQPGQIQTEVYAFMMHERGLGDQS